MYNYLATRYLARDFILAVFSSIKNIIYLIIYNFLIISLALINMFYFMY